MGVLEQLAPEEALVASFSLFAEHCLKIRPKEVGQGIVPFVLNPAQVELHRQLNQMRRETGKVRALVLKGRQMGVSTYVGARLYHQTITRPGVRTFILTQEQDATDALFEMTRRYHENNPLGPDTGFSSTKEMTFPELESGYKVGTAGSKAVGRGQTIQFFHGSEVAFWPNADSHVGGILEAVPNSEGTEIIFESTANGPAGIFYQMCRKAMAGEGEFRLIFLPWWLFPGYSALPPSGWEPNDAFREYQERNNLTRNQIYWAFKKNEEKAIPLGLDPEAICWLFRQEYPQSAVEAFQTAGDASFIAPEWVFTARDAGKREDAHKRFAGERPLPMVLGVDPAQGGGDSTVIIDRVGREAGMNVLYSTKEPDVMQIALTLSRIINLHHPSRVFIDHGGGGKELGDILSSRGYADLIRVVNFGGKASDPSKFVNKRAEMWSEMRDWFRHEAGVSIADDDGLHAAIVAPIWGPGATKETLDGRLQLEPKEHIRTRLGGSPDEGDALALTFAEPVEMSGDFDAGDWDDDTVFRLNGL
jgi:hypothetical protein